jgi:hypothetical protein
MQRVGGDSATFEGQKVQHFQGTSRLVATRRFLLSQGHAGIHRKDIDHLQRRGGPAALVGAAQGLAVDCHHACEVETIGLGKGGHEAAECEFESLRLEQTEHPAERIVARDAMLQAKEEPHFDCPKSAISEHDSAPHSTAANAMNSTSKRSCLALSARGSGNRRKTLLNLPIRPIRESSSESLLSSNAIDVSNPYAIPLPC